jgi:hypothetical protein
MLLLLSPPCQPHRLAAFVTTTACPNPRWQRTSSSHAHPLEINQQFSHDFA